MTLRFHVRHTPLLLAAAWALLHPAEGHGQEFATLAAQENFRRLPNGVILARLSPGARLRVLERDGDWTQVALTGWVWLPSLDASEDPAYDFVVTADGGENLRIGPSGTVLGHVEEGALLSEVGRQPSWAQVSRVGWIWSASIEVAGSAGATTSPAAAPAAAPADGPDARVPGGFVRIGDGGGPILAAPDGETLAVVEASSEVQVTDRDGSWARVRLEGWMWMPVAADGDATLTDQAVALEPDDLARDPGGHAGRAVSWTLQFISLERAEAVRTDFFEGEPFLLARFGGGDGPFVYVAVPTDQLAEVEGLVPLERVVVTGRIRTGASELTGAPILDLVSIERSPGAP